MSPETLWPAATLVIAIIAAITDVWTGKIPNWLTFPAALIAFAAHGWVGGLPEAGWSALSWLLGVIVFLPLAATGKMGMGDIKLLGAIGAWWGLKQVVQVMLYAAVVGIPHALLVWWFEYGRNAIPALITSMSTGAWRTQTIGEANRRGRLKLHHGLDYLAGVLLVWYYPMWR